MSRDRMHKLFLFLLLLALAGFQAGPARAQAGAQVELLSMSAEAFPTLTASFRVYDGSGNAVTGLEASAVSVLEDGQPRPLDALQETWPGVQLAVAINSGPGLATQDALGVSRLDIVLGALRGWATALPADSPDDLSLVTAEGLAVTHMGSPAEFLAALDAYQPNPRNTLPTLDTLSRAIDIVSEPAPRPGMKRALLFVTSLPDVDSLPVLDSLTARALELDVRVHVWIVASRDFFTTSGATALKDLAIRTGGLFATFSGQETLPDPESYLTPHRSLYRLTYTSALAASGAHGLAVLVTLAGESAISAPIDFELDVQPPNPILVSPPAQIVRQLPEVTNTDPATLAPVDQGLELIIEFPDGHPRPLARTVLYVDGLAVAENTAGPFDRFNWDLRGYTESGQHTLSVEAVDTLGLGRRSLGVPVTVTVVQPPGRLPLFLTRYGLWMTIGVVLIAGLVLCLVLFAPGRRVRRKPGRSRRQYRDPVTQPIQRLESGGRLPSRPKKARAPVAYLARLKADGQLVSAPPIPLLAAETTFGADPTRAERLLDDPSVAPLHARLTARGEQEYYLSDEKTVAGTWVNYEPIGGEPRRLQHGDIIHFGQISYRFMLTKPPARPAPRLVREHP